MSTEERVKDLMASNLQWGGSWDEIDADYPLLERRVIDSLGMMSLISLLEQDFGIRIDDAEVVPSNFKSIRDIAALVDTKS